MSGQTDDKWRNGAESRPDLDTWPGGNTPHSVTETGLEYRCLARPRDHAE